LINVRVSVQQRDGSIERTAVLVLRQLRTGVGRRIRNFKRIGEEGIGHNFIADVRTRLPHLNIETIFDVGAHIGVTALEFGDAFPRAVVYAFEPHPLNFGRLKSNLVGKPETRFHQLGMGAEPGFLPFEFDPNHPSMARIAKEGSDTIEIDTIDRFCGANAVDQIDLMKIDVEGHEMAVLKGASGMLSQSRISIIKMETAIDPDTAYHTQLFDLCSYLQPFGYRLLGFYDQWESTLVDSPALRRFDAVFISREAQSRGLGR
jgi:FkbM family methyltransferase